MQITSQFIKSRKNEQKIKYIPHIFSFILENANVFMMKHSTLLFDI